MESYLASGEYVDSHVDGTYHCAACGLARTDAVPNTFEQSRDLVPADRRQVKDNVGWVAGDQVSAQFAFAGGVNATYTSDARLRETTGHWGLEFHGSKGIAKLNCDLSPAVFVRSTTGWSVAGKRDDWKPLDAALVSAGPEHNLAPVSDWLEAIAQDRELECGGRNGAWAVEMVMAVYQAALSGGRAAFPLKTRTHPLAPQCTIVLAGATARTPGRPVS